MTHEKRLRRLAKKLGYPKSQVLALRRDNPLWYLQTDDATEFFGCTATCSTEAEALEAIEYELGLDTDERYTPPELIEKIRATLGGTIDLDPMSCAEANDVVGAQQYFGRQDLALSMRWVAHSVYLNPPGTSRLAAHRAFAERYRRDFDRGALMLYDWDHSTRWFATIANLPDSVWVLLPKRYAFTGTDAGGMHDVGRSQAVLFVGVDVETVKANWPGCFVLESVLD
jgi:hypothetical protein